MRLLLLLFTILITAAPSAFAQDIEACGVPEDGNVSTTPSTAFCDIYARQLAYRIEANAMRAQMNERNEAFAASRRTAYQNYLQDLEMLNEERALKPSSNTPSAYNENLQ